MYIANIANIVWEKIKYERERKGTNLGPAGTGMFDGKGPSICSGSSIHHPHERAKDLYAAVCHHQRTARRV